MQLHSGSLLWPTLDPVHTPFPPAAPVQIDCDAAVVGAGITGALAAWSLASRRFRVVVIDRGEPAWGSTVATTALIQYELDVSLADLAERIGWDDAAAAYRLCADAVDGLAALVGQLDAPCGFARRPSLYLATTPESVARLRRELELRRRIGIDIRWVGPSELKRTWRIDRPGALLSTGAAEVDPFRLTLSLLRALAGRGSTIVPRAGPVTWTRARDRFVISTAAGATVRASHLIIATGYEARALLKERIVDLDSTYAIATGPLPARDLWPGPALIWENTDPYLYVRTIDGNRLIIGGEDERFESPAARDALLAHKAARLAEKFHRLMPHVSPGTTHAWTGNFGKTRDGLPYAGESPEYPGVLFNLCFGGNGITFGIITADLLARAISGAPTPHLRLFRFARP